MIKLIPAILFVCLMVACFSGLVMQYFFLERLRNRHTQTWESLGRPSLFMNNSISNSLAVLGFLWRRKYLALEDIDTIRFARFLRGYLIAYLIGFVGVVITSLLVINHGRSAL